MNILFTLNDAFVPQVATCIASVVNNLDAEDSCHFYLFSDGISEENQSKLKDFITSSGNKVSFVELNNLLSYFDFDIDTNGWASVVLARLLVDKLLPNDVERIIYLDGDTLLLKNIKSLWEMNLDGKVIGMCPEPTVSKKRKEFLGLSTSPYHNSGVLLIDLKQWREREIGKKVFDFYRENDGKLFAPDQDALNGALKDDIKTLSVTYNYFNIYDVYPYRVLKSLNSPADFIGKEEFLHIQKEPDIVHYLGEERPWRIGNQHRFKEQYLKTFSQTPWNSTPLEDGWQFYFICFNLFNFLMKPFPLIRYYVISGLIPAFMKLRKAKLKRGD
ncbi:TPA: glycosyltransferase family 8 protein [Streptococcus suis]